MRSSTVALACSVVSLIRGLLWDRCPNRLVSQELVAVKTKAAERVRPGGSDCEGALR